MIMRLVMLVAVLLVTSAQAQEAGGLVGEGRRVFQDQGCYGCHMVGKTGTPIAPDLSHIGTKRDRAYLVRWLRDPSEQRPSAHMPKLQLSEPETESLAAYLSSLR